MSATLILCQLNLCLKLASRKDSDHSFRKLFEKTYPSSNTRYSPFQPAARPKALKLAPTHLLFQSSNLLIHHFLLSLHAFQLRKLQSRNASLTSTTTALKPRCTHIANSPLVKVSRLSRSTPALSILRILLTRFLSDLFKLVRQLLRSQLQSFEYDLVVGRRHGCAKLDG